MSINSGFDVSNDPGGGAEPYSNRLRSCNNGSTHNNTQSNIQSAPIATTSNGCDAFPNMLGRYYRPAYRYSALYSSSESSLIDPDSCKVPLNTDNTLSNNILDNQNDNTIKVNQNDTYLSTIDCEKGFPNDYHRGQKSTRESYSNKASEQREKAYTFRSVESHAFECLKCGSQHKSQRGLKIHIGKSSSCKPQTEDNISMIPNASFLETLQNYKANTKLIRRIPRAARLQAAIKYTSIVNQVVREASNPDAWEKLALFTFHAFKLPINSESPKKSASSVIKSNLQSSDLPTIKQNQKWKEKSLKLIVEAKISEGDISGALRTLTSEDTLAPQNKETLDILLEKHPPIPSNFCFNVPSPSNLDTFSPSPADVEKAIFSFPAGSAGGLDGLRPQHLKDMIVKSNGEARTKLLLSLVELISVLLSGNVPESVCPWLYGASLTALKKKDGGIRPIAVGNVLRRLTAKLACQSTQTGANQFFQPIQLGCGTRGGAEAAVHAIRHYMSTSQNDEVLVKLDFKNAFNSINRGMLLEEIYDKFKSLYPFIYQCYRYPTYLSFGRHVINSEWGVQQGDPLGPLCFCLVAHRLAPKLKSKINIWYMDDVTLVDTPSVVLQDIEEILKIGPDIGLSLNSKKSEFYLQEGYEGTNTLEALSLLLPGAKQLKNDITILGVPLTDSSIAAILLSKIEQMKILANRLTVLQSHFALHVLQKCLGAPRLLYTLRCCPSWNHLTFLKILDNVQRTTLERICNISLSPTAWKQATLPISLGGLGIRSTEVLSIPAFLASAHSVTGLVCSILQTDNFIQDSLFLDTESLWITQHSLTIPEGHKKSSQNAWVALLDLKIYNDLISNASDLSSRARLLGVSTRESGSWLNALPCPSLGTFLDDDTIRVAIALRVGSRLCIPHACRRCGYIVDPYGHHSLSCDDFGRRCRHSQLNETIHRALTLAGIPSSLEPAGICRSDGKRPDGITLTAWSSGKMLLWDVTVSDTLAPSYIDRSSKEVGFVANQAEQRKRNKYAEVSSSFIFAPVGMETLGVWGKAAKEFLKELGRRLITTTQDDRSSAFFRQRISLDIQRGNAFCFKSCLPEGCTLDDLLP